MGGLIRDSKLLQVMRLLYQMQPEDRDRLEAELLAQEKRAWDTALTEKGRQYTGRNLRPNAPSGADLVFLKQMAQADADSIAATYNRAVERQLNRLFQANPRGNRSYYAKGMEAWARDRERWHPQQVAGNTVQRTREYAKERFMEMNGIRPKGYTLAGPVPVCDECIAADRAGVVDEAYIRRHPMPAHPGCDHEWEELPGAKAPALRNLWLG